MPSKFVAKIKKFFARIKRLFQRGCAKVRSAKGKKHVNELKIDLLHASAKPSQQEEKIVTRSLPFTTAELNVTRSQAFSTALLNVTRSVPFTTAATLPLTVPRFHSSRLLAISLHLTCSYV